MEKKNVIFLSVIAVATLLTAVIGTTFAYFTAQVGGNDTGNGMDITTAKMEVTYAQSSTISIDKLIPGQAIDPMKFTVTNTGGSAVDFNLAWTGVTKSWAVPEFSWTKGGSDEDIKYTLKSCDSNYANCEVIHDASVLPNADGVISTTKTLTLNSGETGNVGYYMLEVTFRDTGAAQDALQGQSFTGKVIVNAAVQSGYSAKLGQ